MNDSQASEGCSPVSVETGMISGLHLPNGTRAFLGIPYAAPPMDELRWRPPQRLQPWSGVRPAQTFGSSSIQYPPPANSIYSGGETEFSEDCLYLNVWTGHEESTHRPVLVWFHFGAFQFGSGSNPGYNGAKLASERGITVVTVNYRLGRFGFFAHEELRAESEHEASGNYGIMDQISALQWVQRNIHSFGGNPANVTVAGASAGGASVNILRSSTLAHGLFAKAICESGMGVTPTIDGAGHVSGFTSLVAAEKVGAELFELLGVSSIAELRKRPAQEIVTAHLPSSQGRWKTDLWPGSISLSAFDTSQPIIDGYVLSESPLTAILSGRVADVPLLAGNVGNEASGMPYLSTLSDYYAYVEEYFGEFEEQALEMYPAESDAQVRIATSQLLGDQVFVWPTWTSARLQASKLKSPVWYYTFLHSPPVPRGADLIEKDVGAFHIAGALYAFGNLDVRPWDWSAADRKLSEDLSQAWANFLHTGRPNSGQESSGTWSRLEPSLESVKMWDVTPAATSPHLSLEKVTKFWDSFYKLSI